MLNAALAATFPSVVVGISIGPPGELALSAVRTSTPVTVTSNVCSTRCQYQTIHSHHLIVRTELGSPFAVDSDVCPIVRPVDLLGLSEGKDGLNRESHARFTCPHGLVFGIMRDPRRRMELSVDAVATPGFDNTATSGLSMLLNDRSEVSNWCARLYKLDGLIQTLPCRLDHSDRF